jgi:hypothetical protein
MQTTGIPGNFLLVLCLCRFAAPGMVGGASEDIIGTGPGNSPANCPKASGCYYVQYLALSDGLIRGIPKMKLAP